MGLTPGRNLEACLGPGGQLLTMDAFAAYTISGLLNRCASAPV
jgi:hypothetical protein